MHISKQSPSETCNLNLIHPKRELSVDSFHSDSSTNSHDSLYNSNSYSFYCSSLILLAH